MARRYLVITLALLLALPVVAATASSSVVIGGLPGGRVQLTVDGTSAAVDGLDPGALPTKRAAVVAFVVSGQAVKCLVRIQHASNGLFIDLVPSNSLGNLTTAVGAMDLSAGVPAHPAPEDDAVDAAAITAAGG